MGNEVVAEKRIAPHPIEATKSGMVIGGTIEDQYRLAKLYCDSGLMPKSLNTPQKVLVALQLCYELGLPPMTSIGKIMVVNGTASIFGELPLALVYKSGKLEYVKEEFVADAKGEPAACKVWMKRLGGQEIFRSFSVEEAKKAGLYRNNIWNNYTKRMLQCRARAWAIKDLFPDVLFATPIAEYDYNTLPEREVQSEASEAPKSSLGALLEQKAAAPQPEAQQTLEEIVAETATQDPAPEEAAEKPVIEGEFAAFEDTHIGAKE